MASSHNSHTSELYRKDTTRIITTPTIKQDKVEAGDIRGIRLLFTYCFLCQNLSAYRAYKIYQNFNSWAALNRKDKFFLAWGIVSTVIMAVFTAAYAVVEFRHRKIWKNRNV